MPLLPELMVRVWLLESLKVPFWISKALTDEAVAPDKVRFDMLTSSKGVWVDPLLTIKRLKSVNAPVPVSVASDVPRKYTLHVRKFTFISKVPLFTMLPFRLMVFATTVFALPTLKVPPDCICNRFPILMILAFKF